MNDMFINYQTHFSENDQCHLVSQPIDCLYRIYIACRWQGSRSSGRWTTLRAALLGNSDCLDMLEQIGSLSKL